MIREIEDQGVARTRNEVPQGRWVHPGMKECRVLAPQNIKQLWNKKQIGKLPTISIDNLQSLHCVAVAAQLQKSKLAAGASTNDAPQT